MIIRLSYNLKKSYFFEKNDEKTVILVILLLKTKLPFQFEPKKCRFFICEPESSTHYFNTETKKDSNWG